VTVTPTPAPTPTPTPTPPQSGFVAVSGTSASAVDAALRAATPGTTLVFGAGTYQHGSMTWPDGVNALGAGIGRTVLGFGVRFGTGSTFTDLTFGSASSSTTFRLTNGARDTRFASCRFRSRGQYLWDTCDFGYWDGPVLCQNGNFHDITWTLCEFEYTGSSSGRQFNIWWDSRLGGGSIYDLTWDRCAFGVRNSSGQFGSGNAAVVIQPSPSEHNALGPRPGSSVAFGFDWSAVTHGAGTAANPSAYGFRVTGCDFVGAASLASFDLCDYVRAWAMTTYRLTDPGKVTQAMKDAAPDQMTSKGWYIADTWFGGNFIPEIGRDVTLLRSPDWQGTGTYHVADTVRAHDTELYGF
jgi:hypothetical protein